MRKILRQGQPVIICDVDEVVLHFVKPFENFLKERNTVLRKTSFRLTGNIINQHSGSALSGKESAILIQDFHESHVDQQPLVDGAADVLNDLSNHFQILFLTNIDEKLAVRRREHLKRLKLPFPLIANSGLKDDAVLSFSQQVQSTIIFIDDLPPHHTTVKETVPEAHCIHFMADETFREMASIEPHIATKAESWADISKICLSTLNEVH